MGQNALMDETALAFPVMRKCGDRVVVTPLKLLLRLALKGRPSASTAQPLDRYWDTAPG
jgi:hypothetical protein